jgi:hypothetical protein
MLAVGATVRKDFAWLKALGLGLLSCAYVLGVAFWVRSQVMVGGEKGELSRALAVASGGSHVRFGLLTSSFSQNIGEGEVLLFFMGLLLFSIPLARTSLARHYLATGLLALALVLMNPYYANFLRHNVFGKYTGQRAFWAAPLPAAFAIAFVAVIPSRAKRLWHALGVIGAAILLVLFSAEVPSSYALGRSNKVVLRWPPRPKVPTHAFAIATALSANMKEDDIVLAPELVSWYLPTVHRHPKPLLANDKYMTAPPAEEKRLEKLVERVSKPTMKLTKKDGAWFLEMLDRYSVDAVVLKTPKRGKPALTKTLVGAKYERVKGATGYQVWLRPERHADWSSHVQP